MLASFNYLLVDSKGMVEYSYITSRLRQSMDMHLRIVWGLNMHVCTLSVALTSLYRCTVFSQIVAAATINFSSAQVRLLIEGGSYLWVALISFVNGYR